MVIQGVTYLSDFEAKKAIMEMARRLEAKGWLVAGDGSMSVRVGPQAVWVTVAGADKAALTQDMLVRVDMNGKAMLSAKPKPPATARKSVTESPLASCASGAPGGSTTNTTPANASTRRSIDSRLGRSSSSHQASSTDQAGIR